MLGVSYLYAQPIVYVEKPAFYSRSTSFGCHSVRISKDKTIITSTYNPQNGSGSFWVNRGCYLQTFDSPRRYNLLYVKGAALGRFEAKHYSNSVTFTQVFEALPSNCTRFKYVEPNGDYETYDLNSFSGQKITFSSGFLSYNQQNVINAITNLISNYNDAIEFGMGETYTTTKLRKLEISYNSPMLTLTCRYSYGGQNMSAYEYRFNVNDASIEKITENNQDFIHIICPSGFAYNSLTSSTTTEDYPYGPYNYKDLCFSSKMPLLNKRFGNGLATLFKSLKNPNMIISTDFDELPSGVTIKHRTKNSISNSSVKKHIDLPQSQSKSIHSTFKPVKATITDSQGSFTSSNFNCPNMVVYDKGSSVQLSWGGENIPLSKSSSPDTYIASQSKSGTTMKFVAYRSSSTGRIYLVICTTKGNGKSVDIHFKP